MIYFLWLIFILFIGEVIYIIFFEKPKKPTRKQKNFVRKKSGRFKW